MSRRVWRRIRRAVVAGVGGLVLVAILAYATVVAVFSHAIREIDGIESTEPPSSAAWDH